MQIIGISVISGKKCDKIFVLPGQMLKNDDNSLSTQVTVGKERC